MMEIELGYIKDYKEKGFGFFSRTFQKPRQKVWFHISKVKLNYPELAKKLDSGSYLGVKVWYEVGKVGDKEQAIQIWLDSQSIPEEKRGELIQFIEDIWSNTSSDSLPNWLNKATLDLVGESRRTELLRNYDLALKRRTDAEGGISHKDNVSKEDDWSVHPAVTLLRIQAARRKNAGDSVLGNSTTSKDSEGNISYKNDVSKEDGRSVHPAVALRRMQAERRRSARDLGLGHLTTSNENIKEEDLRIGEISRLARKYRLTNAAAEEFHQLLVEMRPLEFKRSNQLSHYIMRNNLGLKYKNISGILRMEHGGEEWDFHGGFSPGIYRIICQELKLGNQGTQTRTVKFTPFKDIY